MHASLWYLNLCFLILGLICAVSSLITTARVAWDWEYWESKMPRFTRLTGDDFLRIREYRIRSLLERYYSRSMLVVRAFTAIAYSVLVVSERCSSGHSFALLNKLLISALIMSTVHAILPIFLPVRLRKTNAADLPFYNDFQDWLQFTLLGTLCSVAIITKSIGLAKGNSPALATGCFFTCLLGCIKSGWILSSYRMWWGTWGLDSDLLLFIVTGCISLSIWAIFILEHLTTLDSLGALLAYGSVISLSAALSHAWFGLYKYEAQHVEITSV